MLNMLNTFTRNYLCKNVSIRYDNGTQVPWQLSAVVHHIDLIIKCVCVCACECACACACACECVCGPACVGEGVGGYACPCACVHGLTCYYVC